MIEPNSIVCGDCLELMKELDDGSVDMILCDLPYTTCIVIFNVVYYMKVG